MANGRSGPKLPKKNAVSVRGAWFAMPIDVLRSRAFASLSPQATKIFLDLCSQLGRNSGGNGRLSAAPRVMELRGWSSTGSRQAAIKELLDARLLTVTRPGNRKLATFYAITLWPLDYDPAVMVHGPGSYLTDDWTKSMPGASDELSPYRLKDEVPPCPAKWNVIRKGEPRKTESDTPQRDNPPRIEPDVTPQRSSAHRSLVTYAPAAGSKGPKSAHEVTPLRDTSIDLPSAGVAGPSSNPPQKKDHTPARPSKTAISRAAGAHVRVTRP